MNNRLGRSIDKFKKFVNILELESNKIASTLTNTTVCYEQFMLETDTITSEGPIESGVRLVPTGLHLAGSGPIDSLVSTQRRRWLVLGYLAGRRAHVQRLRADATVRVHQRRLRQSTHHSASAQWYKSGLTIYIHRITPLGRTKFSNVCTNCFPFSILRMVGEIM